MKYIIIIGAFQSLVALSLFMTHRQKRQADTILNWILLCIFTHLCIKFVIYAFEGYNDIKAGFNTFIDLAYGPLLWTYARKIENDKYHPLQHWYLFIPTLLASVMYFSILLYIITGGRQTGQMLYYYNQGTLFLIVLQLFVYPILSLRKARQLPAFWNAERLLIKRVSWLYLAMGCMAFSVGYFILPFQLLADTSTIVLATRIVGYSQSLIICLLVIQYRLTPADGPQTAAALELQLQPAAAVTTTEPFSAATTRRILLPDEHLIAIIDKLTILMEKKKAYADPELTLEKLATISQLPRHHISEALNHHLGKTFYQFVNDFRMKEVLALLDKCKRQHITPGILSLAFEAGFNSKSTFNQYFKKTTGYTPSEYLKRAKAPPESYPNTAVLALK